MIAVRHWHRRVSARPTVIAINPGGPRVVFCGLDVSLDETAICIVNDAGDIVKEGKAETDPQAIATWLGAVDVSIERLGLEAGPLSPWLHEGLQSPLWRQCASRPAA